MTKELTARPVAFTKVISYILIFFHSWDTRSTNASKATHTVDAHTAEVSTNKIIGVLGTKLQVTSDKSLNSPPNSPCTLL